jgi:hypothetical protein
MAESRSDSRDLIVNEKTRGWYFAEGSSKRMYELIDNEMLAKLKLKLPEGLKVLAFTYFLPAHGMTEYRLSNIKQEIGPLNKEFASITPQIYGGFKLDVSLTYFMDRDALITSFTANQDEPGTAARDNIVTGVLYTIFIIEKLDCNKTVKTTYTDLRALVDTIIGMGYCWTDIKINNICKGLDGKLKIIDLDPEYLFKLDVVVDKTGKDHLTILTILKNYMIRQLYSTVKEENIEGKPEMLPEDLAEKDMLNFIKNEDNNKIFVEAIIAMQSDRSLMSGDDIDKINGRTPYAMYNRYTAPAQGHKRSRISLISPHGQVCSSDEKYSHPSDAKKANVLSQVAETAKTNTTGCAISGGRMKKRRSFRVKGKKKPSKKYRSRRRKYTKRR